MMNKFNYVFLSTLILFGGAEAMAGKKAALKDSAAAKCESRGESIRRCFVGSDAAELELNIAKNGGQIFMTLENPALMALDDAYVNAHFTEKSVLFTLKNNRLPKGHKLIVRTKAMILTLTFKVVSNGCLLYTSPSPRDATLSRMPSSA